MSADIQLIKDKLGIVNIKNLEDIQNMNMKNDDIEKELEEYHVDKGKN